MSPPRDEIRLRDATPEDAPILADLHVRVFRETHGGGPDPSLRERQWREKFSSPSLLFCLLLEHPRSGLIGFASGQPHSVDDGLSFDGLLDKIYLLREFQRRGLGRRLFCAACARFREGGITSMLLFGDARSPSNGFYEAMGGERLCVAGGVFHGGYGWSDLTRLTHRCGQH